MENVVLESENNIGNQQVYLKILLVPNCICITSYLFIFDSFIPHKSSKNISNKLYIFYFTFNKFTM